MMKNNTLLLASIALISLVSFAAGWWLRPLLPLGQERTRLSAVNSRGESSLPTPPATEVKTTEAPPAASAAAPFRSWADVVAFLADGELDEDPLMIQDGIARLLNTGASDLATILEQSAAAPERSSRVDYDSSGMARSMLLFRWSMMAPDQAATFALSHPEMEDISAMTPYFLGNLARANPALAESLLAKLPEDERTAAATELHFARAAADPAAFLQDPAKRELLAEDSDLETRIFNAWVKKSPSEAAAWFRQLPAEQQTESSLGEGLMRIWMSREPTAALAWLQALPAAEVKAGLGKSHGATLIQSMDPEAFAGALEKLPSDLAPHVLRGAIENWPDPNATNAKALLLKCITANPAGTEGSEMAAEIVRVNFQSDASGQKALQFLQELPAGPAQDKSMESIAESWAEKDPEAASKWVTSLPEGSAGRDLAAKKLVEKIQTEDPEGAMLWALSINAAESKQEALKDVFHNWLPEDPYGALKALGTLTPEMQEALGFKR